MPPPEWTLLFRQLASLDIPESARRDILETAHALRGQMRRQAKTTGHLQAMLDSTVDGIITIDAEGCILSFNPAAEQIFGYRSEEILGHPVERLMPSPDRERHAQYMKHYLHTGERKIIGIGREVTGLHRNGERFPLDLSISEIYEDGKRFFIGVVRNITDRKRAEAALEQERSFINAVFDTVGALLLVLDPEGVVVRINRACERLTGYRLEELQGSPVWKHLLPEEEIAAVKRVFREVSELGLPNHHENSLLTRDGKKRRIAWSNTALYAEDGTLRYVIGTGIDITEQARSQEAIVAVSESERKVIGQELHDALGQEMTGITLMAGALEMKLRQQERPESEEAFLLTRLSQDVLTSVKRLAQGLYPTDLERSGLSAALIELMETQNRLSDLDCRFLGDREAPALPATTELHLYRIAQEASSNAIRHSQASRLTLHYAVKDRQAILIVEDNGQGLPTPSPSPTGMGLTIMRYRAVEIGADLEFAPRPGGGTQVRCTLSLAEPPSAIRFDP